MKSLALAIATLVLCTPEVCAEEIGRLKLNGREVVIDSSGTWRYSDPATQQIANASDCQTGYAFRSKRLPLSVCFSKAWRVDSTPDSSMEFQAHNTELDFYVGVIAERIEITEAMLRYAALYNAASATGVRPEDIPVLFEKKQSIAGRNWNYLEYDVVFSGTKFRFGNYSIALTEGGAVQLVFWSSPKFFDKNKSAMTEVVDTLSLTAE